MTTTEIKEPATPGNAQNDDTISSIIKSTNARKSGRTECVYGERDREAFYKDLQSFHESKNTPLARFPKINGQEVDLHKLYMEVISRGGWLKVNIRNEWDELLPLLGLKQKCVNASVALKYIYTRYLDKFEKLNFLGEDPDRVDEPDDEGRHKKWSSKTFHSVPMIYNYSQHNVSDSVRAQHKFSTDLYKASEYDKLMLSLISPLPNEQDFAINVCTLMANESKHTLKLEHCPKLLDALLAHAGVYCHFTLRDLFFELYTKIRRHSLQTFWTDCLNDKPQILELSYDDYFQSPDDDKFVDMGLCRPPLRLPNREYFQDGLVASPEECIDMNKLDFLTLGRGLGTHDYIGQRVHQVASIIRNLSFFEENTITLAKNRTFIRFLVMCSNVRWGNLHHMALDVFGNIAMEVDLCDPTSDELTRCMLSTICEGLEGQDRGVIISCLEILYKISQRDTNEEHLHKCLDHKIYNQISLFLSLNDIMLLLYTLECIYALSSLGQRSCNALIQVKGIVDSLVSLITVEAQSYGPDGCILMRVVETVPGNMLPMVAQNIANLQNAAMQGQSIGGKFESSKESEQSAPQTNAESPKSSLTGQPGQTQSPTCASPNSVSTPRPVQSNPTTPVKEGMSSPQTPVVGKNMQQQQLQENEQFALAWLAATFEQAPSSSSRVEQQELYKMYLVASQKTGRRGVVSPIHFPRLVRTVLGVSVGPNLIKTTEANGVELNAFYYVCIRVRANPMPIHYKGAVVQPYQPNQVTNTNASKSKKGQQQSLDVVIKTKTEVGLQLKTNKKFQAQQQHILQPSQSQHFQQQPLSSLQQHSNQTQQIVAQAQESQVPVTKLPGKNILVNKTLTGVTGQQVTYQMSNNSTDAGNTSLMQAASNQSNGTQSTPNQSQNMQVLNTNTANGNGPTTSSSLIKSLLANKVTTTATDVTETNASAAPNNPSCLITQNVNLHQVAQRQHLQKQKELAQQQQQQQNVHNQQQITLPTTSISALVNNPIIQTTAVKVGQTTIKAITTNAVIPATIIEKKMCTDAVDNSPWDPVPPLAPLSGNAMKSVGNTISLGTGNDDSNSTGNNSVASSAISSTQINTTDDGEGSLISFEGLLVPKSKSGSSSVTEDDGNSKDSFIKTTQMYHANQMLVDLLDKKHVDPPLGMSMKRKLEDELGSESENPGKRILLDNQIEEIEDEEIPVSASKNAANFYAEMAASILEEEDLEEEPSIQMPIQHTIDQKQVITLPVPLQRQIIVAPNNPHQMILSQQAPTAQVQTQATATLKTDGGIQTVPLILQKQVGPGGQQIIQPMIQQPQSQTQYVLATNPQGQTYLVAQQPQTSLNQTLLLAQTPQQQGTPTKTIIILQQQGGAPQGVAQQQIIGNAGSSQKMIMTTQQGQQMIVTQVPRTVQHHQIIMNHPNMQNPAGANMVLTQSGHVIQQSQLQQQQQLQIQTSQQQLQIQNPTQQQIQKQIQLQQPQPTIQSVQQQQQASILSQLPHIPATIKIHQHQAAIQTQTSQTPIAPKNVTQKPTSVIQQPTVSIVAQQQVIQQAVKSQAKLQEKKQIFVTGSGNIEVTEVPTHPVQISTPPLVTPPPPPLPTTIHQSIPIKQIKSEQKVEDDQSDLNWLWVCDWRGCPRKQFKSMGEVYRHACTVHCPDNLDPGAEIYCQWGPGTGLCDNIPRKRFSLMTHLFDRHCTVESFKSAVQRRIVTGIQPHQHSQPVTIIKNAAATAAEARATSSPTLSTSSSSSLPPAASAAMHAIKRHSSDFTNPKELMDENEGPVTKSIRLTAALILRNLVSHTALAKKNVRYYEPHLAGVALSNVESSRTISQILFELDN